MMYRLRPAPRYDENNNVVASTDAEMCPNIAAMDLDEALKVDDPMEDKKKKFILLRATGLSFSKISEQIDVSKPTLVKWTRLLKTEINELRTVELEELREQYFMSQRARIELLGTRLTAVNNELATRDMTDVPAGKLFEVMLRLMEALRQELTVEADN